MRLFSEDDERQIDEAIVDGFAKGQGEFDDLDFAAARSDVMDSMIRASTVELLFEGRLGIVVDHGIVKYKGVGGPPES
jgi:hypothetical protein